MIYKFRILSDEIEEFIRVFEVPDNITFFKFHLALQKELEYDNSQIACFYQSNGNWEKVQEFSLFDLTEDNSRHILSMETSVLKDFVSEKKDRLMYVFDIFSERILFMELVDIIEENGIEDNNPVCTYSAGNPPQQIVFDKIGNGEFDTEFNDEYDEDSDLDSDFNLDEAGFDDE